MKKILALIAVALSASCSPVEAATLGQLQHAHQVIFNEPVQAASTDVMFTYPASMTADAAAMTLYSFLSDNDHVVQSWRECSMPDGGRLLTAYGTNDAPLGSGEITKIPKGWQAIFPAPAGYQCGPLSGGQIGEWPSFNYLSTHASPMVQRMDVSKPLVDFYDAANLTSNLPSAMALVDVLSHTKAGAQADFWFTCSTEGNGVLMTAYTSAGKPLISGQVTMSQKAPAAWHAVAPVAATCGHGPTLQGGWYTWHHFTK